MTPHRLHEAPHEIVLSCAQRPRRRVALIAVAAALLLHVGGAAAAVALSDRHEPASKPKSQPLVVIDHVIDLNPPAPELPPVEEPPPPPPPVEKKAPPPRLKEKAPPPEKAPEAPVAQPEAPPPPPDAPEPVEPPSEPPPAAQAGQVLAADTAQADSASFKIATGSGSGYAGGTTTSSGTGTKANHTGQIGVGTGNGLSHARPPQVRTRNPDCGWPSEAEELDLEEAFVTLRADVRADGSVSDVEVLSDPGYGFAKRAALCARSKMSFEAARDAAGAPIAAKTPPMKIRFVRDDE